MSLPQPLPGIVRDESGSYRTTRAQLSAAEILQAAEQILAERFERCGEISSASDSRAYLRMRLIGREQEVFMAVFLDCRLRVIESAELFHGTIDAASVYPRVVVQRALHVNAAAVILAHNHPSGLGAASQADKTITRRLQDALALVDVRVLDHFVVGADEVVSFAECGWL